MGKSFLRDSSQHLKTQWELLHAFSRKST
jgi:hypothetical protein